jgi:integrase
LRFVGPPTLSVRQPQPAWSSTCACALASEAVAQTGAVVRNLGVSRGWVVANPVRGVARPRGGTANPDIRYLTMEEVDAVLRAVPEDELGSVERPLYLAAVMTGMRRGGLLGLRWSDIDWEARRIRVRRSYVRGEFGPLKSRRSSRSVPLTDGARRRAAKAL